MDRTSLPVFTVSMRPLVIPPELLALPLDAEIIVSNGRGGNWIGVVRNYVNELREMIDRQSDGFYTVQEASNIFSDSVPGLNSLAWQEKMKDAWRCGELVIRDVTKTKKSVKAADVTYLDLVKESDLDAWLAKDGGGCRFPKVGQCATTTLAETASDGPKKRKAKKPTIEAVALDYMREVYKTGQFPSAASFHKHLTKTAGANESPFQMGTGEHARKLFCPAASSFFDAGTLGKIWAKVRAR